MTWLLWSKDLGWVSHQSLEPLAIYSVIDSNIQFKNTADIVLNGNLVPRLTSVHQKQRQKKSNQRKFKETIQNARALNSCVVKLRSWNIVNLYNEHDDNNKYIYICLYIYMSISKSYINKIERPKESLSLPNKWLSDFGHHLFLEEGSQVPKLFQQQDCFHCTILEIRRIFCNYSAEQVRLSM